jgi:hypothetical protein
MSLQRLILLCSALTFLTICAAVVPLHSAIAAPTQGDYDADGRADLSVAIVYPETRSSAWLTRMSGGGFGFWNFSVPADAFVSGNYFGNNRYYPGVVYVRDATKPLEWYIKTPSNGEVFVNYGLAGDTVPNQQDVDCDGITDFIVTRNGTPERYNGYKLWYIALSGSGGKVVETLFGLAGDRPGLADMDGDSCFELVVLRPGFFWYARKLFASDHSAAQWGLPGDIPLWPQDINGDGAADYIVSRRVGAFQQAYVRYNQNQAETFTLGFSNSIPQVGNFLGLPFFTWHQRDTGWVALGDRTQPSNIGSLVQFGVATNHIIRADGSVVGPNSEARFPDSTTPPPPVSPLPPSQSCTVNDDFRDGVGVEALWKPVSESKGRPVFLLNRDYWLGSKKILQTTILDRNNQEVASATFRSCCPNGNRAHFDVTKSASALKPSAPLTVKLRLQNGTVECRRVEDPTVRYD